MQNQGRKDVNKQVTNRGQWVKGRSGNPAGRPIGARQKLEEPFLDSLRWKWESEGDAIVDRVARDNPEKVLEVMARVLPKEVAISVEQRGPMDSETVRKLRRVIDLMDACGAGGIAEETVLAWIEEDLRARLATEIGGFVSSPLATAHASSNEPESDQ
jgi:hypothetical protein